MHISIDIFYCSCLRQNPCGYRKLCMLLSRRLILSAVSITYCVYVVIRFNRFLTVTNHQQQSTGLVSYPTSRYSNIADNPLNDKAF